MEREYYEEDEDDVKDDFESPSDALDQKIWAAMDERSFLDIRDLVDEWKEKNLGPFYYQTVLRAAVILYPAVLKLFLDSITDISYYEHALRVPPGGFATAVIVHVLHGVDYADFALRNVTPGDTKVFDVLLARGADLNFDRGDYTDSVISTAIGMRVPLATFEYFLQKGMDPNATIYAGRPAPPHPEAPDVVRPASNNVPLVDVLETYGFPHKDIWPEERAAVLGMVRLLLQYGANPSQPTGTGVTPLFRAVIASAHDDSRYELIELLTARGASHEVPAEKPSLSIEGAALHSNCLALVRLMAEKGYNDYSRPAMGAHVTPYTVAVSACINRRNPEVVRYILENCTVSERKTGRPLGDASVYRSLYQPSYRGGENTAIVNRVLLILIEHGLDVINPEAFSTVSASIDPSTAAILLSNGMPASLLEGHLAESLAIHGMPVGTVTDGGNYQHHARHPEDLARRNTFYRGGVNMRPFDTNHQQYDAADAERQALVDALAPYIDEVNVAKMAGDALSIPTGWPRTQYEKERLAIAESLLAAGQVVEAAASQRRAASLEPPAKRSNA